MADFLELKFLGQAGFVINHGDDHFMIDPYLSNYVVDSGIGQAELFSRAFPPPLEIPSLRNVQVVFITHDHADHCDPHTLLPLFSANSEMKFIGPRLVANHLIALGIDPSHIIVPVVGELMKSGNLQYYAVAAAHYDFGLDAESKEVGYFGYVICVNGKWIYHAGDTILYDGMVEQVLRHTPTIDLACLPVNGRDGWRERVGMIGNLDGAEALGLTKRIHADVLIPMHNDLFQANHVNPAVLADLADRMAPRQKIHWLQPGESFYYPTSA